MRLQILWVMASILGSDAVLAHCQITNKSPSTNHTDLQATVGSRQNPLRVSSGIMAGLAVQHKMPFYPSEEGPFHSGVIVLHAVITPEGKVDQLTVISGPESLRKRALEAVYQWTYKPYLLNKAAVWVQTTISMNIDFGGE